jgi:hypothetical protein
MTYSINSAYYVTQHNIILLLRCFTTLSVIKLGVAAPQTGQCCKPFTIVSYSHKLPLAHSCFYALWEPILTPGPNVIELFTSIIY